MRVPLRRAKASVVSLVVLVGLLLVACAPPATPASTPSSIPAAGSPSAKASPAAATAPAVKAAGPADKVRLGLGVAKTFGYLPAYALSDWKIQEKYNLDVELLTFAGEGPAHQALAAGSVDILGASGIGILAAAAKGSPERFVAQIDKDISFMYLLVSPSIQTVDDLAGKQVGVTSYGSITPWLVNALSKSKNWTGDKAIKPVPLGPLEAQLAGLKTNQIVGFVWTEDVGFQLEKDGVAKRLLSFGQVAPNLPFELLAASNDLIDKRPDVTRRAVAAYFDAIQQMRGDRARTIALAIKHLDLTQEVAEKTYDSDMANLLPDGVFNMAGMKLLAQGLVDLEVVPEAPDPAKFMVTQFVPVKLSK